MKSGTFTTESLKTRYLELVNGLPEGELKEVLQEYMRLMENSVNAYQQTLMAYRR